MPDNIEAVWDWTKAGHSLVYGTNDMGKSTALKTYAKSIDNLRIAVIDLHDEYEDLADKPNVDRYVAKRSERHNKDERRDFFEWALRQVYKRSYDVVIIDEEHQYVRDYHDMPPIYEDLLDNAAHSGWNNCHVVHVYHLPQEGNSRIREKALYVHAMRSVGRNAIDGLNAMADGFGDVCKYLQEHERALLLPSREYLTADPLPESAVNA